MSWETQSSWSLLINRWEPPANLNQPVTTVVTSAVISDHPLNAKMPEKISFPPFVSIVCPSLIPPPSRSSGLTERHERRRDHGQAGPAFPASPQLVHPGHVCHQWRWPLWGPWLAGQSTEEQEISSRSATHFVCLGKWGCGLVDRSGILVSGWLSDFDFLSVKVRLLSVVVENRHFMFNVIHPHRRMSRRRRRSY